MTDDAASPYVPTEQMIDAGKQAGDWRLTIDGWVPRHDSAEIINIWQAMWDAAKKDAEMLSGSESTPRWGRFAREIVLPVLVVLAVIGFAYATDPPIPAKLVATVMPHASAELCYAYYIWTKQAHDTSPGMERECSKP